jgi:hypothetical protein
MKEKIDKLQIYRNYLSTLATRQEYGDKYGDTEEIVEMYEKQLGKDEPLNKLLVKALKKEKASNNER